MKYSFYSLLDDKLNNRAITLGGFGGVYDTLEIKEDGSGVFTGNTKLDTIDYTLDWQIQDDTKTNTILFSALKPNNSPLTNQMGVCDKFAWKDSITSIDEEGVLLSDTIVRIRVNKTKATSVETFKTLLQTLGTISILHKVGTPIITAISKEIMPTILTQATNTFSFGEGVAPYKVTIQVPVNRIAEMQAELDEIKALIQAPSNINLTMNYIEDEYNKNQSVEGVV